MSVNESSRESTLKEYCDRLPDNHRVNQEFDKLRKCIGLLNSIVHGGEEHSVHSNEIVVEAKNILCGAV